MQGGGGGGGGVGSLLLMNPTILPSIPTNSLSFLPLTRDPSFIRVHTWSKSPTINHPRRIMVGKTGNQQSRVSSEKQTATAVAAVEESPSASTDSGTDVVRNFYGKINSHDLASVENLIADNCVYEDLIFPQPFVGRKAILQFFEKFTDSISTDLQFVIDDISDEDSSAVGVTWHLEWQGKPFPFSKGCSFYRLEVVNGKRQIMPNLKSLTVNRNLKGLGNIVITAIYGRDSVEPFIKPGETALIAIRGVTRLLERFPQLVDRF